MFYVDDGVRYAVLLFGARMLGQGTGNVFVAPEHNGVVVVRGNGIPIKELFKEASGYFGPSDRQLRAFDLIAKMDYDDFERWVADGCQESIYQVPATCPDCGESLLVDVAATLQGLTLLRRWNRSLDFEVNYENVYLRDMELAYCPTCGWEGETEWR